MFILFLVATPVCGLTKLWGTSPTCASYQFAQRPPGTYNNKHTLIGLEMNDLHLIGSDEDQKSVFDAFVGWRLKVFTDTWVIQSERQKTKHISPVTQLVWISLDVDFSWNWYIFLNINIRAFTYKTSIEQKTGKLYISAFVYFRCDTLLSAVVTHHIYLTSTYHHEPIFAFKFLLKLL